MCDTCRILAARVEELTEELRQANEKLRTVWSAPRELKLTAGQEALLRLLLSQNRAHSEEALFEATRTRLASAEYLESNLIHSMVSYVRAKLKPYGLSIETVYGRGYRLPDETRARLLNWTSESAPISAAKAA